MAQSHVNDTEIPQELSSPGATETVQFPPTTPHPSPAEMARIISDLQKAQSILTQRADDDASERNMLHQQLQNAEAVNDALSLKLSDKARNGNPNEFPDDDSSRIMPSGISGFNELCSMGLFANSTSQYTHLAATVICNHSDFQETDQIISMDSNTSSAIGYLQKQCGTHGSKQTKLACEGFEKTFNAPETTNENRHASMVKLIQFLSQTLSLASTGRILIHLMTRRFIAGETLESSRQTSNVIHNYSLTANSETQEFIQNCDKKLLDTSLMKKPIPNDTTNVPGINRLNSTDPQTQHNAWKDILHALFLYLFKGRTLRTRDEEAALHDLSSSESHDLYMSISSDGTVEDGFEWLSRYNALLTRLSESATFLKFPKLNPDDVESIKMALSAAPPELRNEIYNLKKFDSRWSQIDYHPQREGSTDIAIPDMTFQEFEALYLAACENFTRPPHSGKTKSKPKPKTNAPAPDTANTRTRKCARCKSTAHIASACPTPATALCNNHKAGKCKNGTNCKYGHSATQESTSSNTPTALTSANTPPAALQNQVSIACRDCSTNFDVDSVWWTSKTNANGESWGLPIRCKKCRDARKARPYPTTLPTEASPTAAPVAVDPTDTTPTEPPTPPTIPTTGSTLVVSSRYDCLMDQMSDESDESDDDSYETTMMVSVPQPPSSPTNHQDYFLSTNSDDYLSCTCGIDQALECIRCFQCIQCCNCLDQHERLLEISKNSTLFETTNPFSSGTMTGFEGTANTGPNGTTLNSPDSASPESVHDNIPAHEHTESTQTLKPNNTTHTDQYFRHGPAGQ